MVRGLTPVSQGRIQLGDVIVEIDGQQVRNEDDYANIMEQHRPGDVVTVRSLRDNEFREYEMELRAPPNR